VKLLFDHNLSFKLVDRLSDLYPDSNHVYKLGLDKVDDTDIREYARANDFIIVTKDADFSDLCLLKGFPPKVVWIRRGNCKTTDIEEILRNHHADIETLRNDGFIGVLTLF
jgi:predicted nuclease of predicted toxin-antitoxin system